MNTQSTDPRCIHAHAIKTGATKTNPAVLNNLITLYSKSSLQSFALKVFHTIPFPNIVSWTSLISAFPNSPQALHHFITMLRHHNQLPNTRTFASLLKTCTAISSFSFALQLHSLARKIGLSSDPFTGSAFVSLYCKAKFLNDAELMFDEMRKRDEVCFSSIIVGMAQNARPIQALSYFVKMHRDGISSTSYSIAGVLKAISEMAMLEQCSIIHGHSIVTGFNSNVIIGTALIDGYGKCGIMMKAKLVFNEMKQDLNIIGWNAIMSGYAQQGEIKNVLELFKLMKTRGLKPDEYSFLAVLTGFYNAGLADETEIWLRKMKETYNLNPQIEHYTCLIGALGKVGKLDKAEKIVLSMPFKPDEVIWRTLLSSCAYNKNTDMALRMSEKLLQVNPNDDSAYVILANVFAIAGKWDKVKEVRKRMKDKGVRKEGGKSWIELHGEVHEFLSRDTRHNRKDEIYAKLEELMVKIEKLGYKPICDEVLHEVDDKEKREALMYHSEKLAFAFGVLNGAGPLGKGIRIVKNVRACKDCHEAFKYFSLVIEREIIVRDFNRYHTFFNGTCNCGDNW